jgi:hypothetical protein
LVWQYLHIEFSFCLAIFSLKLGVSDKIIFFFVYAGSYLISASFDKTAYLFPERKFYVILACILFSSWGCAFSMTLLD